MGVAEGQRAALVTGGSKGIGYGIAAALSRRGYRLYTAARGMQRLSEAATRVSLLGAQSVHPVVADLTVEDGLVRVIDAVRGERHLTVYHNAGEWQWDEDIFAQRDSLEHVLQLFALNTEAPTRLIDALPRATHVIVSSTAAVHQYGGCAVYSVSKRLLDQRVIERLYRGLDVRSFFPGNTDTPGAGSIRMPPEDKFQPAEVGEACVRFAESGANAQLLVPKPGVQRQPIAFAEKAWIGTYWQLPPLPAHVDAFAQQYRVDRARALGPTLERL